MLAAYRKLRMASDVQRLRYQKTVDQTNRIVDRLATEFCEVELNEIERLRRELRLLVKGTPLIEELTPADKEPLLRSDPGFSQTQYDAHTAVLKRVYRKLAQKLHPDKGGDRTVWDEVEVAFGMRDLNRLNAIWFSIIEGRNLYWQQSDGVYHVSSEYHRYGVELELLKQTPGWRAARLHIAGSVNTAVDIVRLFLADKIAALLNEINYVITKEIQNGEERRQEGENQGLGLVEESGQESEIQV